MTRKDYEAMAKELGAVAPAMDSLSWGVAVKAVARVFERDNPRFDAGRFLAACADRAPKRETHRE